MYTLKKADACVFTWGRPDSSYVQAWVAHHGSLKIFCFGCVSWLDPGEVWILPELGGDENESVAPLQIDQLLGPVTIEEIIFRNFLRDKATYWDGLICVSQTGCRNTFMCCKFSPMYSQIILRYHFDERSWKFLSFKH